MEFPIVASSAKSSFDPMSNTGISSPVSLASSASTDFIAFKEYSFRPPSWHFLNKDTNPAYDVDHYILQSSNQDRPENLESFWQEFGFVFSVSMSQILTVTICTGVGPFMTNSR